FRLRRGGTHRPAGPARGDRGDARPLAYRCRPGGGLGSTPRCAAPPPPRPPPPRPASPIAAPRPHFPILARRVHDKPLVYLDNAATTQKPRAVIDAERDVYERSYANIHRGVHLLSVEATDAYEQAREKARAFLN